MDLMIVMKLLVLNLAGQVTGKRALGALKYFKKRYLNNVLKIHKEVMIVRAQSQKLVREKQEELDRLREQLRENNEEKLKKKIEEYENRLKEASREHNKMIEILHSEYNENINVSVFKFLR